MGGDEDDLITTTAAMWRGGLGDNDDDRLYPPGHKRKAFARWHDD